MALEKAIDLRHAMILGRVESVFTRVRRFAFQEGNAQPAPRYVCTWLQKWPVSA